MAIAFSAELASAFSAGTASAGLAGAPIQTRGSKRNQFSFTIPASGAGSTAGDQIIIGIYDVTANLRAIELDVGAMGSAVTLAVGRIDPNNSANNDNNRYLDPTDVSVPSHIEASKNLPDQLGTDPAGDQSTGNTAPGFGQLPIQVVLTIGGTPTAARLISGYLVVADRAQVG